MLDKAITIARRRGENEFEQLRARMLDEVQGLAANAWTDYNLHDPGVTILEQLCYALTDINHRSNYSVDDMLVKGEGYIYLHDHGLFASDEAFCCRPVSRKDLIKYLLDRVPDLAHVDIRSAIQADDSGTHTTELSWLHNIVVKTRKSLNSRRQRTTLVQQLADAYHQVRNLGENLNAIKLARDQACQLQARVQIDDESSGMEILSQIFCEAQRYLLAEVPSMSGLARDVVTKDVHKAHLDGPRLKRAYICDEQVRQAQQARTINGLLASLNQIPGVIEIDRLSVSIEGQGRQTDDNNSGNNRDETAPIFLSDLPANEDLSLRVILPADETQLKVSIIQNNRSLKVDVDELAHRVESAAQREEQKRRTITLERDSTTLEHELKQLSDYCSVQTQFPNNYGINKFGVPRYGGELRRAQARQLRGYLMLFDQIMSDHLAITDNIKELFSCSLAERRSYPSRALSQDSLPTVGELYQRTPEAGFLDNDKTQAQHWARKNRVFDYLGALNGRDKEEYGLEIQNPYFSEAESQQHILVAKKKHLESIHHLAEHRGSAFDYSKKSWGRDNISTLERHVLLKLGLEEKRRSLVYPLVKLGLTHSEENLGFHFNSNEEKVSSALATLFYQEIDQSEIENQAQNFAAVPSIEVDEDESRATFDHIKQSAFGHRKNLHSVLFNKGANLDNYKLGQVTDKTSIELYLRVKKRHGGDDAYNWLYLASFKDTREAATAANQMCCCLQKLNMDMEGLHLVEHCLLLPVDQQRRTRSEHLRDLDFYQHQVSVLLPNWSARMADQSVQAYIRALILRECPAHIYPHIYCLSYAEMERFEVLFKNWCDEKANFDDYRRLNKISFRLVNFLQRQGNSSSVEQAGGRSHE